MSLSPSEFPAKPESVAKSAAAASEWDRICHAVGERGNWEDWVWTRWLEMACALYVQIAQLTHELHRLGRGPHTAELAALLADTVELYRHTLAEFHVPPSPFVRLRLSSGGDV